jgi:hypothetical protein
MSDELSDRPYSAFWPVLILVATFTISNLYQLYELLAHRSAVQQQIEQAKPNIPKAQAAHDRLIALLKDVVATSQKDQNALLVVREATQAGIIRQRPSGSTPPPATDTNATTATP